MYFAKLSLLITSAVVYSCGILCAQPGTTGKTNKAIVIDMNRLFNEGKTDSAMLYFSDSLTGAGRPGVRSPFRLMQEDIDKSFPGVQTKIQDIWEEGDWVIARCRFTGSHEGVARLPHHGGLFVNVTPTHKSFSVQHIRMYKVVNGKIVARQAVRDDLGMYQQLGLLPAPAPFTPPADSGAAGGRKG